MVSAPSDRQPCSAHFVDQFAGAPCIERAAKELDNFSGSGPELVGDRFCVVTVTGQLGFEIVDACRKYAFDDGRIDELMPWAYTEKSS